jgi:galactokinase
MKQFFCPGRTELAGNHTDHQKGRVIAAAVDEGITAQAQPNNDNVIRIFSQGFDPVQITLDKLWPDKREIGTSAALVRGMAAQLSQLGCSLHGFDAQLSSDLTPGAGLASSAAFSILVGTMIADFSPEPAPSPEQLAHAAQRAENRWFGKPCGLMDQLACALGGCVYIDFLENRILPLACDLDALGLALCLTDTGSSHTQATAEYAAITADMTEIAHLFGQSLLAQVRQADFDQQWPEHITERSWMRARHFFDENWRVSAMTDALGLQDGQRYMELMNQSGRSSETLLQNIETAGCGQDLSAGLAASAKLLRGRGAWRVHGGGFGGCVQALMPEAEFPRYRAAMDALFGVGSCQRIRIYPHGAGTINS